MKITADVEITGIKIEEGKITGKGSFTLPDDIFKPPVVTPPVEPEKPPVEPEKPPVVVIPPGTGISSGFQNEINAAAEGKVVVIAKGTYANVPNLTLKPGVSLIGFEKDGVVIKPQAKKGYVAGSDNSDAWLRLAPGSRFDGKGQTIANLKILGEGAQGGIFSENVDNLHIKNIEVGLCAFMGTWFRNSKGLRVDGLRLYDNSWCTTGAGGWASGEFCYVELDDFDIKNVHVSSTSKARGYGFKVLWGEISKGKWRNLYSGKFSKLRTDMNHDSNWDNGRSHNIGFEIHNAHIKGKIVLEDSDIENQVSLHQADASGSTGSFRYTNNRHNGENDRYAIELIMNNVEVDGNTIKNCSQFLFNGQDNIKVANTFVHHNNFDQGTAPDVDWGATFLFGKQGASNVNIKTNTIRRRAVTELLKFQGTQGGVNIDPDNVIKTY